MNTNYTDTQLKQALAKMLPEKIHLCKREDATGIGLYWQTYHKEVLDTELLHLCRLVEEGLDSDRGEWASTSQLDTYQAHLRSVCIGKYGVANTEHATWQQRTIALAKVKGLDIQTQTYTSAS